MKVRKKPVVVDAWKVSDLLDMYQQGGAGSLPETVRLAYGEGLIELEPDRVTVATLEGVMTGPIGWWLIRGVKGEWYPCDNEAFDKSYDILEPGHDVPTTMLGVPLPPAVDPYEHSPEV